MSLRKLSSLFVLWVLGLHLAFTPVPAQENTIILTMEEANDLIEVLNQADESLIAIREESNYLKSQLAEERLLYIESTTESERLKLELDTLYDVWLEQQTQYYLEKKKNEKVLTELKYTRGAAVALIVVVAIMACFLVAGN